VHLGALVVLQRVDNAGSTFPLLRAGAPNALFLKFPRSFAIHLLSYRELSSIADCMLSCHRQACLQQVDVVCNALVKLANKARRSSGRKQATMLSAAHVRGKRRKIVKKRAPKGTR
jgi:hypothetical protein